MRTFLRPLLVLAFLGFAIPVSAQYFPSNGRESLHQRALDARSRLNVLSIALQPGYEDLAGLAYFRMGRGARIVSAYVTNGEAGESDVRGEYPNQLAAERRNEAAQALAMLGGEEYFLNMPDVGAARDTDAVYTQWDVDTLALRLGKLLTDLKPDVILIARNWAVDGSNPEDQVLLAILQRAIRRLEPTVAQKKAGGVEEMFQWSVDRVLLETGSKAGMRVPVDRLHPLWKKSYLTIGDEAASFYKSCATQRLGWYGSGRNRPAITYQSIYSRRSRPLKSVDDALPAPAPESLKGIDTQIASVTSVIAEGSMSSATRSNVLARVAALLDSVDEHLGRPLELSSQGRKICMQWKLTLERLRVGLLGIEVRYSIDPSVLTERQLTFLRIDTVRGIREGDSTWVYFPMTDRQWLVDENTRKTAALRFDPPYRIVTPFKLEHDLPAAMDGLSQTSIGKTFTFFILCKSKTREGNFIFRGSVRLLYAERFSAEALTPIVRAVDSERLLVRLTNHSRDGVRDSVQVNDSLVVAARQQFRLNVKDESQVDTLVLHWKRTLDEGSYLVPISIDVRDVARFAARSFEAKIEPGRMVALITSLWDSPTAETLRRLGVQYTEIKEIRSLPQLLAGYRVAILDRRGMTLMGDQKALVPILKRYVEGGGHLIVLAQDAASWNAAPLVDGLRLKSSNSLGEAAQVEIDSVHRMFSVPNRINWLDWENWLYRRSHNVLSGPALSSAVVPLRSKDENAPLIVEWKIGSGVLTYVDLALYPQFLNIHAGAFRLLANLVSY
ncbi:MAG: PIG-L family deacetylase [Bacteroidota bacterium]